MIKKNFDLLIETIDKQLLLYKTIRKDLLRQQKPIKSKLDKLKAHDKRMGRKDWKNNTND